MAKRPNNGDLINVDNLEKSRNLVNDIVSLMQKLNNTSDAKAWTANLEKFESKYTELMTITGRSNKMLEGTYNSIQKGIQAQIDSISKAIDLTYDYIESESAKRYAIEQNIEKRKEENRLLKDSDSLAKQLRRETTGGTSSSKGNWVDSLKSYISSKDKTSENNEKIISDIQTKVLNKYKGKITEENYDAIRDEINKEIKGANLKEFSLGAEALKVGADTLKVAADVFISLFKGGINRQYNVFENTYNNVSTRTGINRSTYFNKQIGARNDIVSNGWLNDVGTSEVMQAWDKMATQGINQADMFAYALDNVVTNKIVPYLDTSTNAFNILNTKLDGQFVKDIRGINKANMEIAGNNYLTQDLLNTIIDEMQPMSDEAMKNLAEGSAEFTEMINKLTPSMGIEQARAIATQTFKLKNYSSQMLRGGSVLDRMDVINTLGYDFGDVSNYNNIAGEILNNRQFATGIGGNSNTGFGRLQRGVINESLGQTMAMSDAVNSLNAITGGASGTQIADSIDKKNGEVYKSLTQLVEQEFKEGTYLTNEQKIVNATENLMTDVATIKEQMGESVTKIVETLISGIGGLFATWIGGKIVNGVIGKGISGIAGSTFGGVGAGILAVGGGIALGATAAALIAEGINEAKRQEEKTNIQKQKNQLRDQFAEEIASGDISEEYVDALAKSGGLAEAGDNKNFFHDWGQAFSQVVNTLGYEIGNNIFGAKDVKDKTLHSLNTLKTTMDMRNWKQSQQKDYLIAFALLADSAGLLDQVSSELGGMTRDDLRLYVRDGVKDGNVNEKYWNYYAEALTKITDIDGVKSVPWKTKEDQQFKINWANYYRHGLDYVPYDNFPAYLHEGEAVITAATANELRALVDEYRNTNIQSASFDVIIQNQTAVLGAKLDALLQAIRSNGGVTVSERMSLVQNSIRNMRSTSMA